MLAISHAPELLSPVGGPQTFKDTSEILFNYICAECCGREAWASLTRGTNLGQVARES